MDLKWKKVFGRVHRTKHFVHFYLEVEAPNGLVISRRKAVRKEDYRWSRIDLYAWTLGTMIREIENQLNR